MRPRMTAIILASTLIPMAAAQQRGITMPAQDGGVREVLESIVIPPISNQPFTATLVTQWARNTGDSGTITLINERQIARDTAGRIYEERWELVPKNGDVKSRMNWIQIADPHQRMLYNCNMFAKTCDLLVYNPERDLAAATAGNPPTGQLPGGRGFVQAENLGTRQIAGMDTTGLRITTTLSPGTVGNDQPVKQVRETWRSEQLAVNLLSIRSGPIIGTQTFTITQLNPAPPDPQLFEVPPGFEVRDVRSLRAPSN